MPKVKGFGWKPDIPDIRDHRWTARRYEADSLPSTVDLRSHAGPIRDQGATGSCVGQSTAAAVDYLRRTDADRISTVYSARFAYYEARKESGEGLEKIDDGAYIRDSIKAVTKIGAAPQSCMPWSERNINKAPTSSAIKNASRWKLGAYIRCGSLVDIQQALANGHPVVFGFSCYSNMFTAEIDRSGIIPMPSGALDGGHAVCALGYIKEHITFQNSWGSGWGDNGFGYMPFAYFENFGELTDDAWALVAEG